MRRARITSFAPALAVLACSAVAVSVIQAAIVLVTSTSPAQARALAFLLPLLISPHLHVQSLVLLAGFVVPYVEARRPADEALPWEWLLGGFAAVTILWVVTIAGFAALFVAPLAAFTLAATRWPAVSSQRQAEPMTLAA